jgi:hypothetical protein
MRCISCGQEATVRDVEFGMEIGLLVVRIYQTREGRMCPECISSTFWTCTLTTLVLGWWGIVSFFVTPFVLVMNVLSYRAVFLSPPYPATEVPLVLDPALVRKLEPYRDEMFQRLFKGESMAQVSEDIAKRVGATAEEVQAFYNNG